MKNPDNIPSALRERDQWLTWDSATDRKQPYWGERKVSWSDPDSWHSFGEAMAKAEQCDSWGAGYVTAANNDAAPMGVISVIDLDGAADAEDTPKEWVPSLDVFGERDAYIEWSQSHDGDGDSGLHIPVAGRPPEWWRDIDVPDGEHEGVDVLANSFCIFTGDRLRGTGGEIPGWGDEIEAWLADAYENLTGETAPPREDQSGGTFMDPEKAGSHDHDGDYDELSQAQIEEMLSHIPGNQHFNDWIRTGYGVKSWDDGATGKRVFESWAKSNSKWEDPESQRQVDYIWNTNKNRSGGQAATVGTLWHFAEQNGWEPSFGGDGYEGTPTARELVARHSDEYEDVSEVPEDIFEGGVDSAEMAKTQFGDPDEYEPDAAETDGGATTASADESRPDADEGGGETDTPASAWENVYAAYVGAEDADERLPARYEATEQLATETAWRGIVENDSLWTYKPDKGIFEADGDERVRETLVEHLREQFKAHEVREIAADVRHAYGKLLKAKGHCEVERTEVSVE